MTPHLPDSEPGGRDEPDVDASRTVAVDEHVVVVGHGALGSEKLGAHALENALGEGLEHDPILRFREGEIVDVDIADHAPGVIARDLADGLAPVLGPADPVFSAVRDDTADDAFVSPPPDGAARGAGGYVRAVPR